MEPTKTLPVTYKHHLDLRPGDYKKGHLIVLLIALPISIGVYVLFTKFANMFRLDDVQSPTWNPNFNISVLVSILGVFIIVTILHESIHGLLLWFFTGQRPNIGFQFPGIGVEAPDWFIPRGNMMIIELAPLFLLTIIGAALLFVVPAEYIGMVAIGSTINVAGSYMDLAVFIYTYLLPKSSYIKPAEGFASIFIKEENESVDIDPKWKSRWLNSLEEKLFPKLL